MATPNLSYQNFFTTTLSSSIVAGDTTIPLVSVPTPSEGYLVIEPDSSTNREIIYYTSVGGSFVTCPSAASGRGVGGTTAISHSSGATVQLNNNAEYWTGLQDGSALSGLHTWFNESFQDYVKSGGTVASATGLIGSISAGVYYINGRRVTTNAASKTFTASKDTYVDVTNPSSVNNIATLSYVEVASGVTAGSALTSNSVRIAKVNTGASTIGTVSYPGYDPLGNPVYPSTPETMLATGAWTTFTPQWTNLTPGSGTNVGYYTKIGRTVFVHVIFIYGSGSAVGTDPVLFLPVPPSYAHYGTTPSRAVPATFHIEDSGTAMFFGTARFRASASLNNIELYVLNAASTYLGASSITATVPMTWTTNDSICIQFYYEAAY